MFLSLLSVSVNSHFEELMRRSPYEKNTGDFNSHHSSFHSSLHSPHLSSSGSSPLSKHSARKSGGILMFCYSFSIMTLFCKCILFLTKIHLKYTNVGLYAMSELQILPPSLCRQCVRSKCCYSAGRWEELLLTPIKSAVRWLQEEELWYKLCPHSNIWAFSSKVGTIHYVEISQ